MNAWIDLAGWTLVHFVWQGALVAAITAAVLRLMRPMAPQARYALACAALAAMVAAPVVTASLLAGDGKSAFGGPRPTPVLGGPAFGGTRPALVSGESPLGIRPTLSRTGDPASANPATSSTIDAALTLFVVLWLSGVATLLLRLAGGCWRVRRIHRLSTAQHRSRWQASAERMAARMRLLRSIFVVDSLEVDTPTVVGWLRPVILLPVSAMAGLSTAQVDAILAHELAHIRRHDVLVNILQTIAETLLFYHPAVWWISGRIRTEREHCCDDVVVEVCGDPVAYAAALTELAASNIGVAPLAMAATDGPLLARVRRVLSVPPEAPARPSGVAWFIGLALAVVVAAGGVRFMVVAQAADPASAEPGHGTVPTVGRLPTDDPRTARAWGVTLTDGAGTLQLLGYTARSLIREAYGLVDMPIVDAPPWIDEETFDVSLAIDVPIVDHHVDPQAVRMSLQRFLENGLGLVTHRDMRTFPAYALQQSDARGLAARGMAPSTSRCWNEARLRAAAADGSRERHGSIAMCGFDTDLTGVTARRVTMTELADEMRRRSYPLWRDREVIDRTGLTGAYDFRLRLGFFPIALAAAGHPAFEKLLARFGFQPVDVALRDQLGLTLVDATIAHEVLVVDRIARPR